MPVNNHLALHSSRKQTPSACVTCRERHLRCDGRTPVCSRCSTSDVQCIFLPSRRGLRGGRRKQTENASDHRALPSKNSEVSVITSLESATEIDPSLGSTPESGITESVTYTEKTLSEKDYLIDVYYQHIHPSHPFLLPRSMFKDTASIPDYLKACMYYIAAFNCNIDPQIYRPEATSILNANTLDSGFKVQALILLILTSFASMERAVGTAALMQATQSATRIGLNIPSFEANHSPLFRGSWARTWWELYMISNMITVITGFDVRLPVPQDLPLPGQCVDYEAGIVMSGRTINDMQDRFFAEDGFVWSSYAYKIEAARLLSTAVDLAGCTNRHQVESVASSISSYLLSVPASKTSAFQERSGDEVISCAFFMIHLASLLLHAPRSGLFNIRSFATICGTSRPTQIDPDAQRHKHAALQGASEMAKLLAIRGSGGTPSPCLSCIIAFGTTTKLSAFIANDDPVKRRHLRENIQLELSFLEIVGRVWPVGSFVRSQLAQFAREILNSPRFIPSKEPPLPALDMGVFEAEEWLVDLLKEPAHESVDGYSFAELLT